jgi:hypothetical protein
MKIECLTIETNQVTGNVSRLYILVPKSFYPEHAYS